MEHHYTALSDGTVRKLLEAYSLGNLAGFTVTLQAPLTWAAKKLKRVFALISNWTAGTPIQTIDWKLPLGFTFWKCVMKNQPKVSRYLFSILQNEY